MKCTPLDPAAQYILAVHLLRLGFIVENDGRAQAIDLLLLSWRLASPTNDSLSLTWLALATPLEYLTYFQPCVTGVLHYSSPTDLLGIQVCCFLVWFNVICSLTSFAPSPIFLLLLSRRANLGDFGA
jgi:hypothetical protein